jgi:CheY-like chemotaxis protein
VRSIERMQAALKRAQIALNLPADPDTEAGTLRIVALCRGTMFSALNLTLAPHQIVCALSEKAAIDLALGDVAEGLVIDATMTGLSAIDFVEKVRAHPDLADIPLLAFAPTYEHQGLLDAGIDRIVTAATIGNDALPLCHAYRDVRSLRARLRKTKSSPGAHVISTEADALRHITLALDDEHASFTLAGLSAVRVEDPAEQVTDPTVCRAVFQMLASLTRAEDVVLDCGEAGLLLILPDVSAQLALPIISRLDGIARHSAFLKSDGTVVDGVSLECRLVTPADFTSAKAMWDTACSFV